MKTRTRLSLIISLLFLGSFFIPPSLSAQSNDDLFNSALKSYVRKLVTNYSRSTINRERFLVQQIRMINDEIKARVTGISTIRKNYFQRLQSELNEVRQLRARLANSGDTSLNTFIDDLEKKIDETIKNGVINFKRQKVIEEAVQLLHVAEEMIRSDPNARLSENPEFNNKFHNTKTEFFLSFGEISKLGKSPKKAEAGGPPPTVFDVYKEWKKTELLKYEVRWTDIQILKKKLLRNGTAVDRERMLKRELMRAAEAFNFGFYDLAERSFAEIRRAYQNLGQLDDCLYYQAEADYRLGRYLTAQKLFNEFLINYPSSSLLPKVYYRLMQIANHFEQYDQVLNIYRQAQAVTGSHNPNKDAMAFMAALAALKSNQFDRVGEFVYDISKQSPFYRESRFILAESYAGMDQLDEAAKMFKSLIQQEGVDPQFRFTVLLKLGYISYEKGDYYQAIKYFDQIGGYFNNYDRVLIGYAWSYYKLELQKEDPSQYDFSLAKQYLDILLSDFYGSDYQLEARALQGYINQLEENAENALDDFSYVFHAKEVRDLSDEFNAERDKMRQIMDLTEKVQRKALEKNNPSAFYKAEETRKKIRGPLLKLSYMDLGVGAVELQHEVDRLNRQLNELERLKSIAEERGNTALVKRIEKMQLKISRAITSVPPVQASNFGFNYFSEHPLARKESVVANKNQKVLALRQELKNQRQDLVNQLVEIDFKIKEARQNRNYRQLVQLELTKERLKDLRKKLDFLETQSYALGIEKTNIRLDHWADYGAFGMTNVRFAIKNKKAQQIAQFQKQINQINEFLEMRKENIEHQIGKINDAITLMTRRVREQERIRQREELKRQFQETYFDTHDTEIDYNKGTTQPPKIKEE